MAKKGFIKDLNNIEMLPITRGELVLDSSGKLALHSNEFLATDSLPGLMSKEDKAKLDRLNENGATIDLVSATTDGLAPKIGTAAASTVTTQADEWVLTSTKGATPTWRKLPTNAFLNYYRPILVNGTSLLGNNNTALNIAAGTNINLTTDSGKVTINNGLTKLSLLTDDILSGKYLPLSGGTIALGLLTIKRQPAVIHYTNYANKTLGYIGFGDEANKPIFTMSDGTTNHMLWHSGNDGHESGLDADTLDGVHLNKLFKLNLWFGGDVNTCTFGSHLMGGNVNNSPILAGTLLSFNTVDNRGGQLIFGSDFRFYFRSIWDKFGDWKTIAFTDSDITGNAATADKLKTKVQLWGNDFDGSNSINSSMWFINNSHIYMNDASNSYSSVLVYNSSNTLAFGYGSCGKGHLTSIYGAPIIFFTGTDRTPNMIVGNNGNVGIGTMTPKCKLSVNPTTLDKNPTLGNLATDGTIGFGDLLYKTYFWTRGNGNGYILVGREDGDTSVYHLILQVLGGNVGIGTNNPLYKLDVNGVILSKGIVIGNEINYSAKSTNGKDIGLMYLSSSNNLIIGKGVSDNKSSTYVHGNSIIFRSKGGVTDLTMSISNHGNVTIGNSNLAGTTYKLYVNGNTNINGSLTASTFLGNLDWSYITNKPTSFTPAAHSHNELIYNKDLRNESTIPTDYNQTFKFVGIKGVNAINLLESTATGFVSLIGWRGYTNDGTGPFSWEMASGSDRMYVRSGNTKTWTYNWRTLAYTTDTYPTKQITALTGYTKATSASDLVTTDTLNTALGKLEYKAGIAYSWYRTITEDDTDEIINKWDEVVDFVNNLEVDLTEEFVTRKTDLTITGIKTFQEHGGSSSTTIKSGSIINKVYTWGGWARAIDFSNTDTNATGETTTALASFGVYGVGYGLQHTGSNTIRYLYLAHQDLDHGTAVFKVYSNKATISGNEIYHKGNLKNLSDLNDDVVRGKYLRLTGGTIKNGTSDTPLILNTSRTEGDIGMRFSLNDVSKGWIGYNNSYGTYLYTYTGPHRLGIKDNGVAYCDSYTLLHSGNYTSYTPILNSTSTHATGTSVIYAPSTAGTKGLVLISNGSGAPYWSDLSNLRIHNLIPTTILSSGSNKFNYVKFASINLTSRYSGMYAILKLTHYFTTSMDYGTSCDLYVHCYQLDPLGTAPRYTIKTNNDDSSFTIVGIVNYSETSSTLDLYVHGKSYTYLGINVLKLAGNDIINIGTNIETLPSGTQVTPLKIGHVEIANSVKNVLTFASGAFSTKTYNGSSAVTVNIPTKTSHLTNDSGFLTQHLSLANYVKKTGDTMSGALTIKHNDIGLIVLERTDGDYVSSIGFKNTKGVLGYIGKKGNVDGDLLHYSSDKSAQYVIFDSNNYTNYINSTNFPGLAGVRSVTINGDYLRVNTNGTNKDLTISYATKASLLNSLAKIPKEAYTSSTHVQWFTLSSSNSGKVGYAGDNTGFPVNNNANGILWLGTHSGPYGGLIGISSDSRIYYRFISSGSFPTTENGNSWKKVAWTSEIPTVTNYYWANVKISSTSSTTTTPTFGALTLTTPSGIAFKGSKATNYMIRFLDNTVDSYGNGIVIGGGGVVIIGSGESSSAILSDATGGTENTYITSDGDILFCSGMDTSTGRKNMVFGNSGNLTVPGTVTSNSGFNKIGSSNSYVLLGGGGHKAISDFLLKSEIANQELSANLTTITKSLTVTADWMDTGIKCTDIPNHGTYIIQVSVNTNDSTGEMYYCYWSGVMTWVIHTTNDDDSDEILLHRSGHAYGNTIYLRTIMTTGTDGRHLRLLIAANKNLGAAYTYTFKFKRII